MMELVVTTGAISRAKLQSNHHHQQTNTQFFTDRMPFLSPHQQCQSTEGKNITFHGLAYPKLTWGLPTLSLTINRSWLPWGRVAMPLISPLCQYPNGEYYSWVYSLFFVCWGVAWQYRWWLKFALVVQSTYSVYTIYLINIMQIIYCNT